VLEHEVVYADPEKLSDWDNLIPFISRVREVPTERVHLDYGGGWHANAIAFKLRYRNARFHLVFGSTNDRLPPSGRITRTKKKGPRVELIEVGVSQAKEKVFAFLARSKPKSGYCHLPDWLDTEYFKQLCGEIWEERIHGGVVTKKFKKIRARNEALDIHVGCYAAKCMIPEHRQGQLYVQMRKRLKGGASAKPVKRATKKASRPDRHNLLDERY